MGQQTMHPEAKIPLQPDAIRANIQEIMRVNESNEVQLAQFSELVESQRQEIVTLSGRLEKLEIFESLLDDTSKYQTCYIRDRVVLQKAKGRLIQAYGKVGDLDGKTDGARRTANRMFDNLVEECLRYGTQVVWHIIKQRLDDNG